MIAGIDPGASGAIAFLTDDGALVDVLDMPGVKVKVGKTMRTRVVPQALALLMDAHRPTHTYVEKVAAMPTDGSSAAFGFGYAAGAVEGVLSALSLPCSFVAPAVWKRALQLPAEKGNARQLAMRLWPSRSDLFARVKDDGRAEACLIAHWGLMAQRAGMKSAA